MARSSARTRNNARLARDARQDVSRHAPSQHAESQHGRFERCVLRFSTGVSVQPRWAPAAGRGVL
eukprot:2070028-Pyramimonas_sp.AAC.1